jgi:hypothetical protein
MRLTALRWSAEQRPSVPTSSVHKMRLGRGSISMATMLSNILSQARKMNLRHAAALALVGWYLMVPHVCVDRPVPAWCRESSDPVGRWTIRDSFDTAAQCRGELISWQEQAKRAADRIRETALKCGTRSDKDCWNSLTPTQQFVSTDELDAVSAKCIASDDPRLAK